MLLRSDRVTNEYTVRKKNSESSMANEPNHGEIPPPITGTVVTTVVEGSIPTSVGSIPTLTTSQTGPLLSYVGPRGPLGTPPPRANLGSRPFVPPGFSTTWMGREQPYGMPTTEMASLMNAASTFSEPLVNASSPLQGSGASRNQFLGGPSHTIPSLTNVSIAILRQQMDESNHDMVQMLAQTLSTVLNPLIQTVT